MRHTIQTEVTIDAAPDVVWRALTDLERYGEWNPFVVSARGRVAVGEQLVNRLEPPGGRAMTFKPTVTEAEPARTFEWLGRLVVPGLFDGRHRFELEPTAGGGTRLVHSEQFSGLLVRAMRRSLDTTTLAGFTAMNEALRDRVEASTTQG
ncbi:MAG: SRPBCC domain-containing protein [Actinomycetota bacterium]